MKTSLYLKIGLLMSLVLYLFDTILDKTLFYKDLTFMEVFITNIPAHEVYNRIIAIALIIIALLLIRLSDLKYQRVRKQKKDDIFADLNNTSVVELVGHQLKTSLSTIIGFSNLMDDRTVAQSTRKMYSEYVYTSSTNLLQLFNNLVDLNRLLNNRAIVLKETCSVHKMLEDVRDKYQADIARKKKQKLELRLTIPEAAGKITMISDCRKMQKIIEKLLENALNFTHEGVIEFGYTLEEDESIQYFVKDEGVGLSLEKLENAFNHYSSRKNSVDASFDLAALRVMVAKKYAELLGGKLWSKSRLGMGSTFFYSIPLGTVKVESQTEIIREGGVPDWTGKRLMVVEDVEPNYLLLNEMLKPTHAEVIWAKNGKEAVDFFNEHKNGIDLILMDIVMPEMDGFEAASQIRGISKSVPIVGQTAYSLEYDKNPDQLINFNGYITKPIWYHELINTITKYLN
ncbi:MAG: response regulator [Bacteroidales bacterium]